MGDYMTFPKSEWLKMKNTCLQVLNGKKINLKNVLKNIIKNLKMPYLVNT